MTVPRRRAQACVGVGAAWLALATGSACADQSSQQAPAAQPNASVSTAARLDFTINIGKFVFFRVGTGAYPTASGTIDTVAFALQPTIPGGAVTPGNGSNVAVNWSGAAPTTSVTGTNTSVAVEVRSNGGTVSLTAAMTTALASGANTIPASQIQLATSDANLPAPSVPNTGTGPAVSVVATAFAGLVTQRSANWTVSYANTATPAAGLYTGQITFTATTL